ncbi:hypothetical protein GDO86_019009 [Hymenochirus boettgeri]|uniref:Phosphoinositide 3-kinase regulatory subunit 6 n=1 Tax=Hymenochirus boettgeri TaxID=247094 RepID=A0A8T2ILJ6_9PIPI|nr:hypothetical protein GDO86_019009 [Hymenochirus boettgeri]
MLRWTLHKSLERNPSSGNVIVGILIKELEKAAYISDELYDRVYVFCKKILTLPKPYCTIGLDYACRLKTEKKVPGFCYQRMVSTEQNLRRDVFHQQDKVLLFLDPTLISEAVCNTLLRETQAVRMAETPVKCMSYIIANSIQAALGKHCDIHFLQQVLKDQSPEEVELWFQEILLAVEHSEHESGIGRQKHSQRMQEIYGKMVNSSEEVEPMAKLQKIPFPSPDIRVHLWTDEDQLWKELVLITKETQNVDVEFDSFRISELPTDIESNEQNRISVWSNDSGIERDLPGVEEKELGKLQRKPCIKKKGPDFDSAVLLQNLTKAPKGSRAGTLQRLSGQSTEVPAEPEKLPTARIVILGDDRALGRLAKAYYSYRKREARRPHRTLKANLQVYCIPVRGEETGTSLDKEEPPTMSEVCEISAYLGRVDPWYEGNINTLWDMIPKLAHMPPCSASGTTTHSFILDATSYYLRFAIQPVYFQIYSVKISFRDVSLEPVEDVFLTELKVEIQDCPFNKLNAIARKKTVTDTRGGGIQIHYKKALASNREREGSLVLRTSGALIKTIPQNDGEDLVCLSIYTDEVTRSSHLSCKLNVLRASSVHMRSLEIRTLTLQLDKDTRRVYTNVASFEVSACPEPCYSLQKMRTHRAQGDTKENGGLSRYMTKSLLLPINTFAGIIQG